MWLYLDLWSLGSFYGVISGNTFITETVLFNDSTGFILYIFCFNWWDYLETFCKFCKHFIEKVHLQDLCYIRWIQCTFGKGLNHDTWAVFLTHVKCRRYLCIVKFIILFEVFVTHILLSTYNCLLFYSLLPSRNTIFSKNSNIEYKVSSKFKCCFYHVTFFKSYKTHFKEITCVNTLTMCSVRN